MRSTPAVGRYVAHGQRHAITTVDSMARTDGKATLRYAIVLSPLVSRSADDAGVASISIGPAAGNPSTDYLCDLRSAWSPKAPTSAQGFERMKECPCRQWP
jgi:hypothetical protein